MKAALVLLCACVALVIGLAVLAGGGGGQDATSAALSLARVVAQACPLRGSVASLGAARSANADALVATAMSASGDDERVARIALSAALGMTDLEAAPPAASGPVGVYGEMASSQWGTPAQLGDAAYATATFVAHLVEVPRWASMDPWRAAALALSPARVPARALQAAWARSGPLVRSVMGEADQPGACGQGTGPLAGPPVAYGLPAGYVVPPGTPAPNAAAVSFALAQLGKPYLWGAAGPAAYDCSGLTMAAWAAAGVRLGHYTGDQQQEGVAVSPSDLVPGDLVLVPGSDSPGPGVAGHVGLYLGDGLVISAIGPAMGVAVQTWPVFVAGGLDGLRDPAPGA
jgi:hypothetical protein